MTKLIIDESRCAKDRICIDECPRRIIRTNLDTGFPEIRSEDKDNCVLCGHCIAVCPHDALDHSMVRKTQCPRIENGPDMDKSQIIRFFRTRRSARVFKDTPVEKDRIRALINIARYAPNANNAQALEWIVLTDKAQIKGLAELTIEWMRGLIEMGDKAIYSPYVIPLVSAWDRGTDQLLRNAPALIFAMAPITAFYGMVDLTIALSHLELAASSEGLIGCWAGLLHRAMQQHESLQAFVGIPEKFPHFYPMMIGYPKYRYFRMPERKAPVIHWR